MSKLRKNFITAGYCYQSITVHGGVFNSRHRMERSQRARDPVELCGLPYPQGLRDKCLTPLQLLTVSCLFHAGITCLVRDTGLRILCVPIVRDRNFVALAFLCEEYLTSKNSIVVGPRGWRGKKFYFFWCRNHIVK